MPERPRAGENRGLAAKLALLVGSVVVSLFVIEIGARLLGWFQIAAFVPSTHWGYLVKPSQKIFSYGHAIEINSWGLRGPEPSPAREGTIRIVFVGDSVTYGGGRIREEDLFCRVIESGCRQERIRIEALNVSAPGWSPQNWRGYVAARGLLGAAVVVLILPECDLARPFATMEKYGFSEQSPSLRLASLTLKLESMMRPPTFGTYDADEAVEANLESVRYLRERTRGVRFLAVLVPSQPPNSSAKYWPRFEAALPEALDLRSELTDARFFLDGVHLSVAGHRLTGERIRVRLRDWLAAGALSADTGAPAS